MKEQDKIIKNISLLRFKDLRVVRTIVYHPLLFAKRIMMDPDDNRPIRIRYFGAFVQKYLCNKTFFKKLHRLQALLLTDDRVLLIIQSIDSSIETVREARIYLNTMVSMNQFEKLIKVVDKVFKAIGE